MKAVLNILNHICAAIFSGFVFSVLWGWFIVTTFGLPTLGIAAALGVVLVVKYATVVPRKIGAEEQIEGMPWAKPIAALIFGAIVKAFM